MKVDLILYQALVFNVFLKKWLLNDVVIHEGRFLYIGYSKDKNFEPDKVIDCKRQPLIPGMIDIHLHIESSMCTPRTFSYSVLEKGVTTIVSEPHEIANVFGLEGIKEMIRVSEGLPLDIFYGAPSSVPSTNKDCETTGGTIDLKELESLFKNEKKIACLGEVMDFRDLIELNDNSRIASFISMLREKYPFMALEGHCPGFLDIDLAKILYMGIDSDHCLMSLEGMKQRIENGMFVELQEKSVLSENIKYLTENDCDGLFCFVTDDVAPNIFREKGHLDHVLRQALKLGMPLEKAIIASSFAPAKRIGFRDRGAIAPGKIADAILLRDKSSDFCIENVFKNGLSLKQIKDNKSKKHIQFSEKYLNSIKVKAVEEEMFKIPCSLDQKYAKCRIIEKNKFNTYTKLLEEEIPVEDSFLKWERSEYNLLLVVDRYTGNANYSQGLMSECIFKNGAIATTYAHDSHNIFAAGDNSEDMRIAMEYVIEKQGGICLVSDGKILASVELPVAGLMSLEPLSVLAAKIKSIQENMIKLGFEHIINPLMSFSTITLSVSPEVKMTDKGIIDTGKCEILDLIIK
jgi:adenine deaminase